MPANQGHQQGWPVKAATRAKLNIGKGQNRSFGRALWLVAALGVAEPGKCFEPLEKLFPQLKDMLEKRKAVRLSPGSNRPFDTHMRRA